MELCPSSSHLVSEQTVVTRPACAAIVCVPAELQSGAHHFHAFRGAHTCAGHTLY